MVYPPIISKILDSESTGAKNVRRGTVTTFLNPVSYLVALKQNTIFEAMDSIFVDGFWLAEAIRLLYRKKVTRRSFDSTTLADEVFQYADRYKMGVCIVSSTQDCMERAVEVLGKQYPSIVWKGCRNGYFSSEEEMRSAAEMIGASEPDILIAGMGAGMQEKFLLMCKQAGFCGAGYSCGAYIQQIAGGMNKEYYPCLIDKLNIRFLYRAIKEPHTRKRYVKAFFLFPIVFIKEWASMYYKGHRV